jgi:sugar phosphate isomerase/epimerase
MRLGGPVLDKYADPGEWAAAVRGLGYRAAYCPVGPDAATETVAAYGRAARDSDIVIAEVGVWNNPLSPGEPTRKAALAKCRACLALAESIGARCCVNIAGSRGAKWDGPCRDDLTLIVESVRSVIDEVRPTRTFYTLEPMPWMYPDSADSYLALLAAVDRKQFGVHFDPVNLVSSPATYFANGRMIRDFIAKLGPRIRSCHAKDTVLREQLTVHLDEVRPGCGQLDYHVYLRELARLPGDVPLMLEHLSDAAEYRAAAEYVRGIARGEGISL